MNQYYFSDGLYFESWWNQEGKDLMPIKESVEVAWRNGAFRAREEIESNTCENCKHYKHSDCQYHTCCAMPFHTCRDWEFRND